MIRLRRRIDPDWFEGQLGGRAGVFPANRVTVLTPLADHVPQCHALSQFTFPDQDGKTYLRFNKVRWQTRLRFNKVRWQDPPQVQQGEMATPAIILSCICASSQYFWRNYTPSNDETMPLLSCRHLPVHYGRQKGHAH